MEELVKMAQQGDREAFVQLMREAEIPLYRVAKAILNNETDVEDAVAEAVCKAFASLHTLRRPKYFKTWLTRILIYCCYDLRKAQKRVVPSEELPELGYEEERETAMDVNRSISTLGENDRLVLTLYYFNDFSVREIGKLLSITESAVKGRLAQGRKKFRQAYEKQEKAGEERWALHESK